MPKTLTRQELLAKAIAAAMDDAGITPLQLEPIVGSSERTIQRWRSADGQPDALQLRPLADALGVDPMLFVDPPEPPEYPLQPYRVGKPMDAAELAAAAAAHGTADSEAGEGRARLAALPPAKRPRKRPARTPS